MLNKTAQIATVILIASSAFAAPKRIVNTTVQVVSSTSNIHNVSRNSLFSYTQRMFVTLQGKNVVYECAQRDFNCPDMEPGKAYSVDKEGSFIYILKSSPDGAKTFASKFKQVGTW